MKFIFASLIILQAIIVIAKPLVIPGSTTLQCPTNACDAYALKNPTKKISCISTNGSRGCIYEYNLNGSTAKFFLQDLLEARLLPVNKEIIKSKIKTIQK